MNLQNIGVIGAGTMGNGIAQVCALAGFNVTLVDISESALQKALATVGKNLDRQVAKETLTPSRRTPPSTRSAPAPITATCATRNW